MTTLLDRIEQRAVSAYTAVTMAQMPDRTDLRQWPMTVRSITEVADHVRRFTFVAKEFSGYASNGPDEYFGLLIPTDGRLTMPDPNEANVRRAVHAMNPVERPELRWYTLRAVRPDLGEADVDIVLHGDAGPGTAWASRARVGDRLGFRQGTALYLPQHDGHELLVADETGAPALAAIIDQHPDKSRTIIVEVPDTDHLSPLPVDIDAHIVIRGDRAPGEAVLEVLPGLQWPALGYAWICGERALATGVRRHLVSERGVHRRKVMFSSFWQLGQARV